jgi:hypothetical protein
MSQRTKIKSIWLQQTNKDLWQQTNKQRFVATGVFNGFLMWERDSQTQRKN